MQRRTMLKLAGATTLVSAGGLWWYLQPGPVKSPGSESIAVQFASGLGREVDLLLQQMHASGKLAPALPAQHELLDLTLDELFQRLRVRLGSDRQTLTASQFRTALQQTLAEEYASGDVIELDGWQLATTELLLAAIAQQIQPPAANTDDDIRQAQIAEVSNWGPRQTTQGQAPNSFGQEGFTALWFDMQDVPPWLEIAINGTRLRSDYREQRVLVATFQGNLAFQQQLFTTPGEHVITLHDDVAGLWQEIATFTVLPAETTDAEPDALCQVNNWGPQRTGSKQIANVQNNGKMGIWVDIECAPADTVAVIGAQQLRTYQNKPGVLTFGVPPELLQPGEVEIHLQSEQAGSRQLLGKLQVIAD